MDNLKMHFNNFFDSLDISHLKLYCKRFFVLSVVLFILLSLFLINAISPSAHAVYDGQLNDSPFPLFSTPYKYGSVFRPFVFNSNSVGFTFRSGYPLSDFYSNDLISCFCVSPSSTSGSLFDLYIISSSRFGRTSDYPTLRFERWKDTDLLTTTSSDRVTSFSFDSSTFYISTFYQFPTDSSSDYYVPLDSITIPIFSTVEEGKTAFCTWALDGYPDQGDPVPTVSSTFTLPAGNVAYISLSDSSSIVDLSATFTELSDFLGSGWSPVTQTITRGQSLPTSTTQFPLSSGFEIQWLKGESRNILGQTHDAYYNFTAGDNYLVIFNPLYRRYAPGLTYVPNMFNPSIVVHSENITSVRIFPLSTSLTIEGISSSSDDGYSSYFDGTVDSETGDITFIDQDGNVSSPVTGGQTPIPDPVGISDILSDFFDKVTNLLSSGHTAIRTLVSSASSFFALLSQMWTWLPSEIYNIIFVAVILVVTVGFFKAFL